jgi:glycosyltransferase involved in cell wall biosynthesis
VRITYFTNTYKPAINGVVTSMSLFNKGLREAGHRVHMIVPQYDSILEDEEPYVFRFPAIDLTESLNASLPVPFKSYMEPTIYGLKPDVIHSQHPFLMGDVAASFAQELDVPLIFTFHSHYGDIPQQYFRFAQDFSSKIVDRIIRRYLEKCTHVIAPTPSVRDRIYEFGVDVPVSVIPTPIDFSDYHRLEPGRVRNMYCRECQTLLLYVGRLSKEKNIHFLLRSFEKIFRERNSSRLLIVGDGPEEERLRNLAADLGLTDAIWFAGAVPHSEVPHYAAAADLLLFPSMQETQGLAVIEAMAAGTPVVAIRTPELSDVLREGGGILVKPDENDFANATISMMDDPRALRELSAKASQVAQKYTVFSAVGNLIAVYHQAMDRITKRRMKSNLAGTMP